MDTFSEALLSEKTDKIPESFDWFAPLLGDWDCDGEYGSSLRMFNKNKEWYDVVYTCAGTMKRLTFKREGDRLVGKVLDEEATFWIFSDITENSFHWEYVKDQQDGSRELVCEIRGKRINE